MADDRTYEDSIVHLSDLIDRSDPDPTLRGYTFRRCIVRGPVVLVPFGSLDVRGCTFAAPDMDSMFFSIPDGPRVGVLPVADTRFEDCTFEHVGWAGDQRLRAVLGGSPEA